MWLGALVGLTSTLGFVTGVIKTLLAAGQLPPNDAFGTVITGIGESANNLGLGALDLRAVDDRRRRRSRAAAGNGAQLVDPLLTHEQHRGHRDRDQARARSRGTTARRAAAPGAGTGCGVPANRTFTPGGSEAGERRLSVARDRGLADRDDAAALLQLVRIAHALEDLADVAHRGAIERVLREHLEHELVDLVGDLRARSTTARPASR